MDSLTDSPEELIEIWYCKAQRAQKAQYSSANSVRRQKLLLGIPTIIFSALSSGFIFHGIQEVKFGLPIVISLLALLASIFASIQTFLGPTNVDEHDKSAKEFGELKRRAQLAKACPPDDVCGWLNTFKEDWDKISVKSPLATDSFFSVKVD